MHGLRKVVAHLIGACEQAFFRIGVQRAQAGRAGQGVAGVGVAVCKLDGFFGPGHEGVMNLVLDDHRAHRHATIGQTLGAGDHVGHHAEGLRRKGLAGAAEAGDDLVKDQQDAVLGAQLAQALKVAHGRDQHARAAGHGLDDQRGDVAGIVQGHQAFHVLGQVSPMRRLAHAEGIARQVVCVADVVHPGHRQPKGLAIAHQAAHRDAAEVDAVVTALAAQQPGACALATHAVVGQRHLQCGFHRFGAAVGKENLAHAGRRQLRHAFSQLKGLGVAHLEGRAEVHLCRLLLDGLHDAGTRVAGVDAPQAGDAVQDLAAMHIPVVHARSLGQQSRCLLELAVGCEGHPVRAHVGRRRGARGFGQLHEGGVDGFVHGGLQQQRRGTGTRCSLSSPGSRRPTASGQLGIAHPVAGQRSCSPRQATWMLPLGKQANEARGSGLPDGPGRLVAAGAGLGGPAAVAP